MEVPVRSKLTDAVRNSDIARLVLGYHINESPETVYLEFAKTNQYLQEDYHMLQNGYKPRDLLNLIHIIQDFHESKRLVSLYNQQNGIQDANTSLTQSLKRILAIQSAKKSRPTKRRYSSVRDSFIVLNNSSDVSDCENEAKKSRYTHSSRSPSYVLNEFNELVPGQKGSEQKTSPIQPSPRPDTSTSSIPENRIFRQPQPVVENVPHSSQAEPPAQKVEEPPIPLKQRLRKHIKKPEIYTDVHTEKKGQKKKINIISDEKVTVETEPVMPTQTMFPGNPFFIPSTGFSNFLILQTLPKDQDATNTVQNQLIMPEFVPTNQSIVNFPFLQLPDGENCGQMGQIVDLPVVQEDGTYPPTLNEMKESTPKNTEKPIISIKSQSTPRRIHSHVRVLNFNTPSGKLQTDTSSPIVAAPACVDASKTPHVRKSAKECARILSNSHPDPPPESKSDEKMREWMLLRESAKSHQWDQHLRALERERETETKMLKKNAKTVKKKKPTGLDIKAQMLEDALRSGKKEQSHVEERKEETPEAPKRDIVEKTTEVQAPKKVEVSPKVDQKTAEDEERVGQEEPVMTIDVATEVADRAPGVQNLFPEPQAPEKSAEKIFSLSALLETPFKDELLAQFPATPRFLIPNWTPAIKAPFGSLPESEIKLPELTTPLFPITPGLKVTPERESPQIGPCNRPTDYSSSSSYYKPDESEDTDQKIENLIKATRRNRAESERAEETGQQVIFIAKTPIKVDNPAVLERVKSFTEATTDLHYNFVFGPDLTGDQEMSSDSSSSSESSSSDSSSSSSSDTSSSYDEEKDQNWVSPEDPPKTNQLINDSGEIRFPLRNWMTPKKILDEGVQESKVEVKIPQEHEAPQEVQKPEEKLPNDVCQKMKLISDLEKKRLRIVEKMKEDQKAGTGKTAANKSGVVKTAPKRTAAARNARTTKAKVSPKKPTTPRKCARLAQKRKSRLESAQKASEVANQKLVMEKKEQEKLEQERMEHEKREQERKQQERIEQERKEQQKLEQERKEWEKREQERKDKERKEQEKKDKERKEQERKDQERKEREKKERERKEQERIEQEQKERERREADQKEKERKDHERKTQERKSQERKSQERKSQERKSQERKSQERKSQERKSQERKSQDRKSQVRKSQERKSQEKHILDKKQQNDASKKKDQENDNKKNNNKDQVKKDDSQDAAKSSSSLTGDESSPESLKKPPKDQTENPSCDSGANVSILAMLEESSSSKVEADEASIESSVKPPAELQAAPKSDLPVASVSIPANVPVTLPTVEEGEIEDSDDEEELTLVTTNKVIEMQHDPSVKPRDFHHNDFNADAMFMKVVLEDSSRFQLSLCDAVNIHEVRPQKRSYATRKTSPKKAATAKTLPVQVPEVASPQESEDSKKSAIKPKISLKYKTSAVNSKNLTSSISKKMYSSPGGTSLPKFAKNQIDVVLQHIHGSERK
ncbi:titin-like isoform X2 [Lutzomyia longipalpis]|uniref:titin-like isoform X2 n=1 Tax=Lutzomyia longipalpis TaxID=7200 RepID=UPI002484248B|nr:titin-like isoform X2 [Lutzomyia longipalpis]